MIRQGEVQRLTRITLSEGALRLLLILLPLLLRPEKIKIEITSKGKIKSKSAGLHPVTAPGTPRLRGRILNLSVRPRATAQLPPGGCLEALSLPTFPVQLHKFHSPPAGENPVGVAYL